MIRCTFWADFGLKEAKNHTNNPVNFKLATLDYDPGLQVGNWFTILNTPHSVHDCIPTKLMEVMVKQRNQVLILDKEQDTFEIYIFVEIADKENFQQIQERLKMFNPEKFENYG